MSRTYRKRSESPHYLKVVEDSVTWNGYSWTKYEWVHIKKNPSSEEEKKYLAKWHSDSYKEFKEPGPSEFRNWSVERPHRRAAKEQLRKFILGYDIEVQILSKPKLEYWT